MAARARECGLPIKSAGAMRSLHAGQPRGMGKEFQADTFSGLSLFLCPQAPAFENEGVKVGVFQRGAVLMTTEIPGPPNMYCVPEPAAAELPENSSEMQDPGHQPRPTE